MSIADDSGFDVRNHYFGTFVQDTWRVNRNLTLNFGLRFEYENGIKEQQDRAMLWFDPNAPVTIAAAAEAAYAANPMPGLPASQFNVQGGSVYAGAPGYDDRTWKPEALVDAALLVRLQARREERHQGRLRRLLRHAERPRLDAQPGRVRRARRPTR